MAIDKLPGTAIATGAIGADQIATGGITVADIPSGEITADKLHTTLNLSSKTLTLPAASVTAHAASQLNDLSDVNTSGLANGKILKYNGSAWVIADDAGGPADTDALSEGSSNLYYTTARANSAIDTRVDASFINNLTINADTATTLASARTISGVSFDGSQNITLNTSAITENTNLYYTDARVKASTLTAGSLRGSVNNATVQYGTSYSGTPAQGSFFFDSLNAKLKVYDGSNFLDAVPAGGGGGGGGSTDANTTFRKYLYTIGGVTNAVSGKDDVIVTAGSFVTGYVYIIVSAGNTDFTAIGSANNNVGTQFTATGAGTGTGTASHKLNYVTDGTENVEVYVNGIKQIQGSANDYVATSGTSVNFVSNLAVNDEVEVNIFELLSNSSNFATLTVDTSTLVVNPSTNRVGIGTTTPGTTLDVRGEVSIAYNASYGLRFYNQARNNWSSIGNMDTGTGADLTFKSGSGTMVYTHSGSLGIGTTTPATLLAIHGTQPVITLSDPDTSSTSTISGNSGHLIFNADSGGNYSNTTIDFQVDNSQKMRIDSNGRVGVGADGNMTAKFTVNKPATGHTTGYQEDIAQLVTTETSYLGRHYMNFFHDNKNRDASSDHTVWGMSFGYDNNTRGGIQYDHKGQERMTLWSSYGTMQFKLPATAVATKRADQITEDPALELKNNGNNLRPRQSAICLTLSGSQGLPGSGTWAWEKVNLNTVVYQKGNTSAWDSGNTRYTCPETGLYLVTTSIQMENNGGAIWRYLFPTINGSTSTGNGVNFADFVPQSQPNATYYHHSHSTILKCSSGDYIEWKAHGSGGGSTIKGGGENSCTIYFLG